MLLLLLQLLLQRLAQHGSLEAATTKRCCCSLGRGWEHLPRECIGEQDCSTH